MLKWFILGVQGCFKLFLANSEIQWDLFKEYKDSPALVNQPINFIPILGRNSKADRKSWQIPEYGKQY